MVSVGLGFYAELTLEEALAFIARRDGELGRQVRFGATGARAGHVPSVSRACCPGREVHGGLRQAESPHKAGHRRPPGDAVVSVTCCILLSQELQQANKEMAEPRKPLRDIFS